MPKPPECEPETEQQNTPWLLFWERVIAADRMLTEAEAEQTYNRVDRQ